MNSIENYLKEYKDYKPVSAGEQLVAFISNRSGFAELWELDLQTKELRQRTFLSSRICSLMAFPKQRLYIFSVDVDGSENLQPYMLSYDSDTPVQLADRPKVMHLIAGLSEDGKSLIYMTNGSSNLHYDICSLNLETLLETRIAQTPRPNAYPISMSADGRYLLYHVHAGYADGPNYICDLVTGSQRRIPEDNALSCEYCGTWTPDGSGIFCITDRDYDFRRVVYTDSETLQFEDVYRTDCECECVELSPDGELLAVMLNRGGYAELLILSARTREVLTVCELPKAGNKNDSGDRYCMSWMPDSRRIVFALTSAAKASRIFYADAVSGHTEQMSFGSLLAENDTVEATLCSFRSFDGLEVPYWLFVPAGSEGKKLPMLIEIHGGPESQRSCMFDEYLQYLISCGIAVAAPNVRGSTGYGKTYCHLDDKEKRLDSVRDIEYLVKHLVETGIADPEKMICSGTSYGGFMTLSCVARLPKLWACAVDIVGMFNLRSFLQRTSEYRRATRETEYGSLKDNWDMLYEVSPAAKADQMETPMIVVHGANDPRVPIHEAEDLVAFLRKKGVEITYCRYEDEGHGVAKLKNKMDVYPRIADFIISHTLGK